MLNVSGYCIGMAEVESALVAQRVVAQAAVVGQPLLVSKGRLTCARIGAVHSLVLLAALVTACRIGDIPSRLAVSMR